MHAPASHIPEERFLKKPSPHAEAGCRPSAHPSTPFTNMDAQNVRALIRQGEGAQVEFKRTISHLPKIAKTLTALANNRGGVILVGVEDNRQVVGVNPEEESFMVLQAARDWCQPAINVDLEEYEHDGATVLLVIVPESGQKPHQARDKHHTWHTYIRTDDKCLMADSETERMLETIPPAEEREARSFTHNEQAAFDLLKRHKRITPKDLAKARNLSRQRAEKLLFELVREGHLFQHKDGGHVWYLAA